MRTGFKYVVELSWIPTSEHVKNQFKMDRWSIRSEIMKLLEDVEETVQETGLGDGVFDNTPKAPA